MTSAINGKIYFKQGNRSYLESTMRNNSLSFDLDSKTILYSPSGTTYYEFFPGQSSGTSVSSTYSFASSSTSGFITSSDWNSFNNKADVSSVGSIGRVDLWGDVVIGDSISTNTGEASWFEFLCMMSNGKLQWVGNDAVGGKTIQYLRTVLTSATIPKKPKRIHLMWGTNNWAIDTTQTIMTEIDLAIKEIRSAGITPIIYAMPPKNDNLSLFNYGNSVYENYCALNGIQYLDIWDSSKNTSGSWTSGISSDGTHPSVTHHYYVGLEAHSKFPYNSLCSVGINAPKGPTGVCVDPLLTSPGSSSGAAWGAGSSAASIVVIPPVSGEFGNWISLQLTSATGIVQWAFPSNFITSAVSGDVLLYVFRIRVRDTYSAGGNFRWQLRCIVSGGTKEGLVSLVKSSVHGEVDGYICTKRTLTSNQGSSASFREEFWIDPMGSSLTGKFEIAQLGVYNYTKMGL